MQLKQLYKKIQERVNKTAILPYILTLPLTVILFLLLIYPLVYLFYLGLGQSNFPYVSLHQVRVFVSRPFFWQSSKISLIYLLGSMGGTLIMGFLIAILLNSINKGCSIFYVIFIAPLAVAPIVAAKSWSMILNPLYGILNHILGYVSIPPQEWITSMQLALFSLIMVTIWRWTPLAVLILYAGLQTLPKQPEEAAAIDGAGRWQILTYITIPLLKPVLSITILLQFITCFKEFDIVYGLTKGGPAECTETLVIRTFLEGYRYMNLRHAAVIGIILLIVALFVTNIGHKILICQQER